MSDERRTGTDTSPDSTHGTRRSALVGALFLMATSAIGPGFITQTATFTATMGAAFGFAILISVLIDFAIQTNVWRMVVLSGKLASDLANQALRGSGYVLSVLIVIGGLVFNIGNIAGSGLGLNALLGLDPKLGGLVSALLAIGIFLYKRAGVVVDRVVVVLGVVMIALTLYVAIVSQPPLGEALKQTIWPDEVNFATITTIVGGTVGGYITYSGAHKLLDSGTVGRGNIQQVTRSALTGIGVTGIMRYVLFLAILGVVASGHTLDTSSQAANPAAQAFQIAAGEFGLRTFGIVFWAAAITSVIGAAYTSVSFLTVFSRSGMSERSRNWWTVGFIVFSLVVYLLLGAAPAAVLVFAGGFNGLVLPIGLTLFMFIGWFKAGTLLGGPYSRFLLIIGTLATALAWYMAVVSIVPIFKLLGL